MVRERVFIGIGIEIISWNGREITKTARKMAYVDNGTKMVGWNLRGFTKMVSLLVKKNLTITEIQGKIKALEKNLKKSSF